MIPVVARPHWLSSRRGIWIRTIWFPFTGTTRTPFGAQLLRALAQRLMRKVCAACAEPVRGVLTPDERMELAQLLVRAVDARHAVPLLD